MTFAILMAAAAAMFSLALVAANPVPKQIRVRIRDREPRQPPR